MPRITREEKQKNKLRLDKIILNLFLEGGVNAILYERIALQSNMSISTVQGYYPTREYFVDALNGKLMPIFLSHLETDKGTQCFIESWERGLQQTQFCQILKLLFHHISLPQPPEKTALVLSEFTSLLSKHLGDDAEKQLAYLLGRSALAFVNK